MKKRALVVGMAKSGIGSAKLLYKHGHEVTINDTKTEIKGLSDALSGIEYINKLGEKPETLTEGMDLMVLSPVIPIFKPFAKEAAERGTEVIGEIELGYRYASRGAKFVCISGTNGKTTTTSLTGEMFKNDNKKTFVLGNIGIPITEYSDELDDNSYAVVETAALQLESIKYFRANAAGMLNISEDHVDRFGSMENYIAAKCRVFENQTCDDFAVLNYDDEVVKDMARLTKGKVVYFSQKKELDEGAFTRDGAIIWRMNGTETEVVKTSELLILGRHNVENALCATALALCMGVSMEAVHHTLKTFTAVEHRIEFVRELDGIAYYNDSKGTNPDSTIRAVEAMTRPTVLILGVGEYDKKSDFVPLFEAMKGDIITGAIVSGINTPAILNAAQKTGFENIVVENGGLELMINKARDMVKPGGCILLSPAAASWGLYDNFEQRGRHFKQIVNDLK